MDSRVEKLAGIGHCRVSAVSSRVEASPGLLELVGAVVAPAGRSEFLELFEPMDAAALALVLADPTIVGDAKELRVRPKAAERTPLRVVIEREGEDPDTVLAVFRKLESDDEGAELEPVLSALSEARGAISIYDTEDRLIFGNKNFYALIGSDGKKPIGPGAHFEQVLRSVISRHLIQDPMVRTDPERFIAERLAARASGEPYTQPIIFDGRSFMTMERRSSAGLVVNLAIDISDSENFVNSMRMATNLFEKAVQTAGVGVWNLDLSQRACHLSPHSMTLLGMDVTTSERSMAEIEERIHPYDRDKFKTVMSACERGEEDLDIELRMASPSKGLIWVHWKGEAQQDISGDVVRIVGSITDITDRKRAEEDSRLNEALLRDLTESVPGVICQWHVDRAGRVGYSYVSPRSGSILGIRATDLEADGKLMSVVEADREAILQVLTSELNTGDRCEFEARYDLPQKGQRWIRNLSQVVHRTPVLTMFNGVLIDVTDIKEIEDRLWRTSATLQATVDSMPTGICVFDENRRLAAWNEPFSKMVRVPDEVMRVGMKLWALLRAILASSPTSTQVVREYFRAIARGDECSFEWVDSKGDIYWVMGRPLPDGGYMALFQDVSAERHARRELQQRETMLRLFVEHSPAAIAMFDLDMCYIAASRRWVAGHGLTGTEIRDRNFYELFPSIDERWRDIHQQCLRGAVERRDEDVMIMPDGSSEWVRWEVRPWYLDNGAIGGVVMFIENIDEQVRRETELQEAHDRLEQQAGALRSLADDLDKARQRAEDADAAKSQFLAVMSHEIRTPMTGLLGMASLLRGTALTTEQDQYLTALGTCADSMVSLLNDLLDFSKFEAAKLELELVDFNLIRAIQEVVDLFKNAASEKGLVLFLDIEPGTVEIVQGDPTRLRQIFNNLINNAIKFTHQGRVRVRVSSTTDDLGRVELWCEVSDTGIGIADDQAGRLFEAFSQADSSTTRRFGGTGLGLAISKRLVELMRGEIGVRSVPGGGSTFYFKVYLREGDPARVVDDRDGREAHDIDHSNMSRRILLAEDNELNAMLISTMLTRWGHDVEVVSDGFEALEAVRVGRFNLVLMDMQMPIMDGAEATRRIRALPAPACDTPVAALTGDAMPVHRAKYLEAGLDAFLTKPIEWNNLADIIAQISTERFAPDPSNDSSTPAEVDENSPLVEEGVSEMMETLIDSDRVSQLRLLPEEQFIEMVELLPTELHRYCGELAEAIARDDFEGARALAHTIKGLAANFGASRVQQLAKKIEREAENCADAEPVLADMFPAIDRTYARIRTFVGLESH